MIAALFDTNIIIDYLDGRDEALNELSHYEDTAISLVTWIEVMAGIPPRLRPQIEAVMRDASLFILPVSDAVAIETAAIRFDALHELPKRRLKLPDAIIQATANLSGRLLITRNIGDFIGVAVRVPYEIAADGTVSNVRPLL